MIIGLGYKKQVGKDTAAKYLVGYYGFQRRAFADTIKQTCKTMFGFSDEQLEIPHLKEEVDERWDITPRFAMQQIGAGMRKLFGDDFWIKKLRMNSDNIVITDVRYKNEFNYVRSLGGKLIKVTRKDNVNWDTHETETALDNETSWDYTVENDGSIEDLCNKIDAIMLELGYIPEE